MYSKQQHRLGAASHHGGLSSLLYRFVRVCPRELSHSEPSLLIDQAGQHAPVATLLARKRKFTRRSYDRTTSCTMRQTPTSASMCQSHDWVTMQVTFWAPAAAGAGVTLVMAYLNGNHIPNLLRFRTMVTKMIGCALCVASGLAIGPEGPLVHIGACVASNITYATSRRYRWISWLLPWSNCLVNTAEDSDEDGVTMDGDSGGDGGDDVVTVEGGTGQEPPRVRAICATCEELHEDAEHREFISAGASAGLSVRFGNSAPAASEGNNSNVMYCVRQRHAFQGQTLVWLALCVHACSCVHYMPAVIVAEPHPK